MKAIFDPRYRAGVWWSLYNQQYTTSMTFFCVFPQNNSVDTKVRAWLSFSVSSPAFPSPRTNQGALHRLFRLVRVLSLEYLVYSRRHRSSWCSWSVSIEYEKTPGPGGNLHTCLWMDLLLSTMSHIPSSFNKNNSTKPRFLVTSIRIRLWQRRISSSSVEVSRRYWNKV